MRGCVGSMAGRLTPPARQHEVNPIVTAVQQGTGTQGLVHGPTRCIYWAGWLSLVPGGLGCLRLLQGCYTLGWVQGVGVALGCSWDQEQPAGGRGKTRVGKGGLMSGVDVRGREEGLGWVAWLGLCGLGRMGEEGFGCFGLDWGESGVGRVG